MELNDTHALPHLESTTHIKILYTPPGAWHGKFYGMARPYFFSRHAKKHSNP